MEQKKSPLLESTIVINLVPGRYWTHGQLFIFTIDDSRGGICDAIQRWCPRNLCVVMNTYDPLIHGRRRGTWLPKSNQNWWINKKVKWKINLIYRFRTFALWLTQPVTLCLKKPGWSHRAVELKNLRCLHESELSYPTLYRCGTLPCIEVYKW